VDKKGVLLKCIFNYIFGGVKLILTCLFIF